jgi:NADPH2:quinone reductase
MKAAYIEAPGSADAIRVGELPRPEAKAGEILIRVKAAALNPIDLYIRAGTVPMPLPKPFITGTDVAGAVEAIGSGVRRFKAGDRVWGSNQGVLGRQGTCAEYVCAAEDWFYPTPPGVDDVQAAGVALTAITAHIGLFRCAHLQAGETAFVNGGTGGVGSMVVQMSKAIGARVLATVGSAEKAELCRRLGADLVLNYKTDDVPARVQEFTKSAGVNVWYETLREPDFGRTFPLLALRGRLIVIAGRQQAAFPIGPFRSKDLEVVGFTMFNASAAEQRACADDLSSWLAQKKLRAIVGKTFALAETAAAHRFLEENTLRAAGTLKGKVIVVP